MKESEKSDAYIRWKNGDVPVIVATRAFGLGINKENVRYVIRNGLPPSSQPGPKNLEDLEGMVNLLRLISSIVMKTSIMLDSGVVTLLVDVEQMKF